MMGEASKPESWQQVATPDERRLIRKWAAWNAAIYGGALMVAVALAVATRSPPETSQTAIATSSTSRLAVTDQPGR
jgi:hypothetical protein